MKATKTLIVSAIGIAAYAVIPMEAAAAATNGVVVCAKATSPGTWPDGSRMDGWFSDRSPVDEARLGRLRRAGEFGAKPDDAGMQTERLQSAIDRIAAEGGGVLVLGAGTWNTSSLFFKPGVHLKLEKGATLKGPADGGDTPRRMTRMMGLTFEYNVALVNADRRTPPVLVSTNTPMFVEGEATYITVKVLGDVRPSKGEKIHTTCGGFDAEGVTVALVVGAPKWVRGLSVNADGNIVLDVKPAGLMVIFR